MDKFTRLFLMTLTMFLAAAAVPGQVCAKDVFVEWKPVNGALEYEIEVQKNGKTVSTEKLDSSKWSGELKPGLYSYRLRAYDKFKRPGVWSEPKALVVMPGSPKPAYPREGDKVFQFSKGGPFVLKWEAVEGANTYKVEVRRKGKVVHSQVARGTRARVPNLGPGEYSWQVSTYVEADGRTPASFAGKSWQSEIREIESFHVERRELTAPEVLFPRGRVNPPKGGVLLFKWKPIEGVEGYEVRIYKKDRSPASDGNKHKAFFVEDRQVALKVPQEGEFTWEVRAVASVEPDNDGKKKFDLAGPQTVTDFKLDPNASFTAGEGYLALSTMLAPYNYRIVSPVTGVEGTFASKAITVRLSGEYWLTERWGVGVGLEQTKMTVLSQAVDRNGLELTARYRITLSESRYGFVLMPKLGLEMRQYPETRPNSPSQQGFILFKPTAMGALLGSDLRYMFSDSFSAGVRLNFFFPVALSGVDGKLGGSANMRNISTGIQGLYWLSEDWGLGAGAFLDMRSISYEPGVSGSGGGASSAQEIYMDGNYFFGSIIYNFGR